MGSSGKRQTLFGITYVVGAATCFATMDTMIRFIGPHFSVALVLWARYGLHAAIMTLWIALSGKRSFKSANPMFQIARGALLAFSSTMAFAALRRMPVAEFTAIVMLTPVVATLVARLWLKEPVSRLRWVLVVGGLVGAWGFHADDLQDGAAPRAATLQRWQRAAPSLAQIEFSGGLARSRNPLLQLDFGAYAKGVAIDAAFDALQRQGVAHALLNLGGNLATMGQPGGRPWPVGVRDPHGPGLLATLATHGREAVVTSGSYERWRRVDGERATHILDPQLGRPAPGLVSVTVVHPSAALADAAATALLVAGPGRWPVVAQRLGVQQVLVVDAHGRWQASDALAPRLQRAAG